MLTKQIKLTNLDILNLCAIWQEHFIQQEDKKAFPVKVFFYLQKNMQTILTLQPEIQKYYQDIIKKYQDGEPTEDGQIKIQSNKIEIANKEINDLLALPQEINIYPIALDAFGEIALTADEMQIISIMVAENFENEEE